MSAADRKAAAELARKLAVRDDTAGAIDREALETPGVDEPNAVEALTPKAMPKHVEPESVRAVAEKIVRGDDLDSRDAFIAEAIIIPDKRPAIDIRNGEFAIDHPDWTDYAAGTPAHARLVAAIPCVGRIELPGHPSLPYGGTGFVIGRDRPLLMTNRHVAQIFAQGVGLRDLHFIPGLGAGIDFVRERGSPPAGEMLRVVRIAMIHPYWDMALLEVEGLGDRPSLQLASAAPAAEGTLPRIAVIGYPAFDPRNDTAVQDEVFGGVYNVKRLQPGLLTGRREVPSFGKTVEAATHDSSTLGGNSGSVVLDSLTGDVAALHFAGVYRDSNFAVPALALASDGRVIDAGVAIAGGGRRASGAWDLWWVRSEEATASAPPPTPPPPVPPSPPLAGLARPSGEGGGITLSVPLTITVSLGNGADGTVTATVANPSVEAAMQQLRAMEGASGLQTEAPEDHGRFEGMPVRIEFHDNGRSAHLLAPLKFIDSEGLAWSAPEGAWLDGASIPRPFWSVIGGPFEGRYREASIVHDQYCITRSRPWQATHRMFHHAMLAREVSAFKARLMFYAVYRFGPRWPDPASEGPASLGAAPRERMDAAKVASVMRDAETLRMHDLDVTGVEALAERSAARDRVG